MDERRGHGKAGVLWGEERVPKGQAGGAQRQWMWLAVASSPRVGHKPGEPVSSGVSARGCQWGVGTAEGGGGLGVEKRGSPAQPGYRGWEMGSPRTGCRLASARRVSWGSWRPRRRPCPGGPSPGGGYSALSWRGQGNHGGSWPGRPRLAAPGGLVPALAALTAGEGPGVAPGRTPHVACSSDGPGSWGW